LLIGCSSDEGTAPADNASGSPRDSFLVGRPQNRNGIGNVDRAFLRYETTRADLIALYREQAWFQDGLTREESLFVERGLSFAARQRGDQAQISRETIRQKLFVYERVQMREEQIELLLIYEPGQNPERQMALLTAVLPELEAVVGVRYPERVMTVVNGPFEINDFSEGQFIRIARCCDLSALVLAHELAHTYWSMGPSWFNEGLADIYAVLALARLEGDPPAGWSSLPADIDGYYASRKRLVESGRFPEMPLPRRLASDGLYEVADVFLLDLRRILGAEAFATVVREVYITSDFGRYILREKRIEDTFLAHAAENDREAIMALFNEQVWGDNGERYRELQELEGP
jgi:hypothetical protein